MKFSNELLRIIFAREHVIIIIFDVLIVNVELYDHELIEILMFVHRYESLVVNHLSNDGFHLLFQFFHVLKNLKFPF